MTTVAKNRSILATSALALVAVGTALLIVPSAGITLLHGLVILILPVLLSHALRFTYLIWMWSAGALWMTCQVVVDLLNRGQLSSIVFVGPMVVATATAMHWLYDRYSLKPEAILCALAVGWSALVLQDLGTLLATGNPWKYGLSLPIALLTLSTVRLVTKSRLAMSVALLGLGAVSYAFDGRLGFVVLTFAALICFLGRGSTKSLGRGDLLVVGAVAGALALYFCYPALALDGVFGARALAEQLKFDRSDSNFLLASRKEIWQSIYLIEIKGFAGIGGYAPITGSEALSALDAVNRNIAPLNINDVNYLLFAEVGLGYHSHSQAVDSVLFGGLGAVPFWILFIVSMFRLVVQDLRGSGKNPGIQSYIGIGAIWSALFSPLTPLSNLSITLGFFIAAISLAKPRDKTSSDTGALTKTALAR